MTSILKRALEEFKQVPQRFIPLSAWIGESPARVRGQNDPSMQFSILGISGLILGGSNDSYQPNVRVQQGRES
jgi:hypothetical protein